MNKPEQEPTESPDGQMGTRFEHPAFGQIGASRVSGDTTLYGSDFIHHHFVKISINRSQLNRDLSRDWEFAREELVEVWLSEAQWASFVCSMNVGMGVPCTLNRVMGERMPAIPLRKQENVVRRELKETIAEAALTIQQTIDSINGELGTALSDKKKRAILEHLNRLERVMSDHLPFAARSFEKLMEKTVEKAKVEVNAYMQNAVVRAGLEVLGGKPPLQIGPGEQPTE